MRRRNLTKLCALALTGATLLTSVPASAADPTISTQQVTQDRSVKTKVVVEGAESTYSIVLPKTMSGNAVNNAIDWDYNVNVTGDIAGNEYVSIVPQSEFTLSQTNKPSITGSVSQDITKFYASDYALALSSDSVKFGTNVTGNVKANNISAGEWKGTFYFNVSLEDKFLSSKNGVYYKVLVGNDADSELEHWYEQIFSEEGFEDYGITLEDYGINSVDEYYDLPVYQIMTDSNDLYDIMDEVITCDVSATANDGKVLLIFFDATYEDYYFLGIEDINNGIVTLDYNSEEIQ